MLHPSVYTHICWAQNPTCLCFQTATCVCSAALLQVADNLIKEAIQQLDGFEPAKAAPLVALAKYIGYRQN